LSGSRRPSTKIRAATVLLELFVVAVVLALVVTVSTGTSEMQALAVGLIVPIVILSLVLIRYCRRGKIWSYAGASALGAFGVALRLIVSTQPTLEVGGGLPTWVSALYIALGASVALLNLESVLELRRTARNP
jgi:hypothetical protein